MIDRVAEDNNSPDGLYIVESIGIKSGCVQRATGSAPVVEADFWNDRSGQPVVLHLQ